MFILFLDKNKPLHTCIQNSCETCDIKSEIYCHFSLSQLITFLLFAFSPFIIAGIGLFRVNPLLLIPYILLFISYFGFIEIKVMCSHCPHYAEPDIAALKCWANYGMPKFWKYKPGPMSLSEKIIFLSGLLIIIMYPVLFLLQKQLVMFIIYSVLTVIGFFLLRIFLCTKCMNFACPFNKVDKKVRKLFFKNNPAIKKAWSYHASDFH